MKYSFKNINNLDRPIDEIKEDIFENINTLNNLTNEVKKLKLGMEEENTEKTNLNKKEENDKVVIANLDEEEDSLIEEINYYYLRVRDFNFVENKVSIEELQKELPSITKTNYQIHSSGEKTGIENYSGVDRECISISVDKLSGVELIQATKATTDNVKITADTKVESGNFRLVVVIDKKIYSNFEINTKDTIKIKNCKDKEIFVYIVGENAKFDASIERELYNSKKAFY